MILVFTRMFLEICKKKIKLNTNLLKYIYVYLSNK